MSNRPRQKFTSIIRNNAIMLGKIAKYTPDYFILMIVEGIIWGFINSAVTVFNYNLLNAVDVGTDFMYAASIIGAMALFYVVAYAFDRWYWQIHNQLMRQKLHLRMHDELFRKSLSLDIHVFSWLINLSK